MNIHECTPDLIWVLAGEGVAISPVGGRSQKNIHEDQSKSPPLLRQIHFSLILREPERGVFDCEKNREQILGLLEMLSGSLLAPERSVLFCLLFEVA